VSACDQCLRRGLTLELLAGYLETERARIDELLVCSDEALVDAVVGVRGGERGGERRGQRGGERGGKRGGERGGKRGGERGGELRRALAEFDAETQRARIAAAGIEVVCRCSAEYPPELLGLRAPPAALYLAGSVRRLATPTAQPAVAIVGARRASSYGIETARSLASGLAGAGVTVVSGMALGVDGAAHAGALEAAGGGAATPDSGPITLHRDDADCQTIAVLPGGPDRPYPASHRHLYAGIRRAGLVVSELPPGVRPRRWMFPARNRIIAGLSTMTVVVQARSRSGALVTARYATQLGRQVGAVPGQASSPLSAGPHALIRGGAQLISDAQDVLDLLFGPGERSVADARRAQLAPADAALLDALDEGHDGHAAFVHAGLGPIQGLEAVATLELAGLVRRLPGGRLTVTGPRPRPD
jgi:DNA processing protein